MIESPIEFYGQVVDENHTPVVDVEIQCSWPLMRSIDGLVLKSSAPDGLFELTGKKHMNMSFSIYPPAGYHQTRTSSQSFSFADYSERLKEAHRAVGKPVPIKHVPNRANPVIFQIKKIGPADTLISGTQGGPLPRDGSPRYYPLSYLARLPLAEPTDHAVECRLVSEKDPRDVNAAGPLSWSLKLRVPGGGLQIITLERNPYTSDYDAIEAPASGFEEELLLDFPKTKADWKPWFIKKELFFRFADNTYARASIDGDWEGIRIESLYNPTGSRNLLYDERKVSELK